MLVGREKFRSWAAFHRENPHVFKLFERFGSEAHANKRNRFSAYMIRERIRWYTMIATTGSEFKMSNNHTPFYARLLVLVHPEIRDLFLIKTMWTCDATDEEILAAHKGGGMIE